MDDSSVPADPPVVPGYVLGACLGRGGSSVVWRGQRVSDGLVVAVKVVKGPRAGADATDQAAREAAVLSRAAVEGVVRVHEAVRVDGDPDAVALVLDLVGGGSLERAVRARGHLSVGEAGTVLVPLARTLAGLHAIGVVHGDISPGNVLLEPTGRPVVADLGQARLVGDRGPQEHGTVGFAAPEVVTGLEPGPAADVYAVGAIAWWCLTGAAPDLLAPPTFDQLPSPTPPTAWWEVTSRALSPDPQLRPSALELAVAYFDAAPCEPLRLVVGDDDTSLLTHRLRRRISAGGVDPPSGPPSDPMRRTRRTRRASGARPTGSSRRHRRESWPVRWRGAALTLGLLVVVAAGVVTTVAVAGPGAGRLGHPPRAVPAVGSSATASTRSTAGTAPLAAADPTVDPASAQRDPRGLMQALASRRARALSAGERSQLAVLDAAGSPALAADEQLLSSMATAHERFRDIDLRVRSARTVSATGRAAVIDAAVDTAAYTVVGATGTTTRRGLAAAPVLRFSLRWQAGRWRVDDVAVPG